MRFLLCLPLALSACFYVTSDEREARADLDGDKVAWTDDCDPDDPDVGALRWYADTDEDGYGDPADAVTDCEAPEGYVADGTDCDDQSATVYPGAPELCNGADDDCDGTADDDAEVPTWYVDGDGDGQGDPDQPVSACEQPSGAVANADDCDDSDSDVKLGGVEVPCNGEDDDCDGDVDLDDTDLDLADYTWFLDTDGDGAGVADPATDLVECTDTAPTGYADRSDDCAPTDPDVGPLAVEACNGFDDNCDNVTDPPGSDGSQTYRQDADGDGWAGAVSMDLCAPLDDSWILGAGAPECDDSDPCVYPGALEICNGIDNDCDNTPDDGCVPGDTGGDTGGGACG